MFFLDLFDLCEFGVIELPFSLTLSEISASRHNYDPLAHLRIQESLGEHFLWHVFIQKIEIEKTLALDTTSL